MQSAQLRRTLHLMHLKLQNGNMIVLPNVLDSLRSYIPAGSTQREAWVFAQGKAFNDYLNNEVKTQIERKTRRRWKAFTSQSKPTNSIESAAAEVRFFVYVHIKGAVVCLFNFSLFACLFVHVSE